jgi:serine/threonine-protein kinase
LRLAARPEALAPEYEIETLLGSGRAGTTYVARDSATGALLAVKILTVRDERHDGPSVTNAIRARLTAFQHPGIARTYAVDVDADGNVRLVRDYVSGKSLSTWRARADAASRREVLETIAGALEAVHASGLFHGHVVPSNIIIGPGGKPVLVDLGAHLALRALQGVPPPADLAQEDRTALDAIRSALTEPV